MSKFVEINDLTAIHAICMEMLCTFDKMCKEAGIVYSLAGGTLLGAVRHKGFIPWDDDVDLFMLREDYEKFLKLYSNKTLENKYYKLIYIDDGAPELPFARLVDNRTKICHSSSLSINRVWIDILPLDGIPLIKEKQEYFTRYLRKLRYGRLLSNTIPFTGKNKWRAVIKTPIAAFMRKTGIRKMIVKKIIKESQKYSSTSVERVGELVAQAKVKGTICKNTFRNYVLLDFEGKKFMAMPDYEQYLQECYGDYMKLPPMKKQRAHNVKLSVDIDAFEGELKEKLIEASYKK